MKILLPFQEDSSLIFAGKIYPKLLARGFQPMLLHVIDRNGRDAVSDRQIAQNIGNIPFEQIEMPSLPSYGKLSEFDAVLVSRIVAPMREMLGEDVYKERLDRPCFIAFQPGLEFTPSRGFKNRTAFDAVFLNKQGHLRQFEREHPSHHWRHATWGHPYFMMPAGWRDDNQGGNVYFFAQAISPTSLRSRQHIVRVLAAIAKANLGREVFIKLRHLPAENTTHVHREEYDYPGIMEQLPDLPPNLKATDCSMADALNDAAVAITCTSTAAMDAISAGVPTAVYLDYVDFVSDPLREPMRSEFDTSGLVTNLRDLLNLRISRPNEGWMSARFRDDSLFEEIAAVVEAFKTRSTVSIQEAA